MHGQAPGMVLCTHTDPSCPQLRCTSTHDSPSALLTVLTIGAKCFLEVSIGSIQVKPAGRQEFCEWTAMKAAVTYTDAKPCCRGVPTAHKAPTGLCHSSCNSTYLKVSSSTFNPLATMLEIFAMSAAELAGDCCWGHPSSEAASRTSTNSRPELGSNTKLAPMPSRAAGSVTAGRELTCSTRGVLHVSSSTGAGHVTQGTRTQATLQTGTAAVCQSTLGTGGRQAAGTPARTGTHLG